jgi:hypothetical protein
MKQQHHQHLITYGTANSTGRPKYAIQTWIFPQNQNTQNPSQTPQNQIINLKKA